MKLAARTVDYEYENFRDFTRFRDRTEDTFAGTLFWKVAPRTDALVEARLINNDYDERAPSDPAGTQQRRDELPGGRGVGCHRQDQRPRQGGMYDREYDSGARRTRTVSCGRWV